MSYFFHLLRFPHWHVAQFLHVAYLGPNDTPQAYMCMDVFVAPYVDRMETFGMAAVEAMAMGVPVLHFNVGGMQVLAVVQANFLIK